MNSLVSGLGPVVGTYVQGNATLGSTKCGEFLY